MKQLAICLVILLGMSKGQAQDCGDLREGQELRLDQANGSMANAKIQDQDGMGTCYANVASQVLFTTIPGLKETPSYLHLATHYVQDNIIDHDINRGAYKGLTRDSDEGNTKESVISSGGHICAAIRSAQKAGGVCPQSKIIYDKALRNMQGEVRDIANLQKSVVDSISNYLEKFQNKVGLQTGVTSEGIKGRIDQKMLTKMNEDLQSLKTWAQQEGESACKVQAERGQTPLVEQALGNGVARYLESEPECFLTSDLSSLAQPDLCLLARDFMGLTYLGASTPKHLFQFKTEMPGSLSSAIERRLKPPKGPQPMKVIGKKIVPYYPPTPPVTNLSEFKTAIEASMIGFAKDRHGRDLTAAVAKLLTLAGEDLKQAYELDYQHIFANDLAQCRQVQALNVLANSEKVKAWVASCNCENDEVLLASAEVASALSKSGLKNLDEVFLFLQKSGVSSLADGLLGVIATDCHEQDKVKIPESLQCEREFIEIKPEDTKPGQVEFERSRSLIRKLAFENFKNQKATGYNICTRFMKEPGFVYASHPRASRIDECRKTGAHGLHAVTGMGLRCKQGKLEYLFLNSWGANWQPDSPLEGGGGKAWVPEETLILNLLSVEYVK